ncbi:MAG: hypothetical protein ABWX96_10875, partial [Propionibacteriaceae bacterium]
MVSRLRRPWTIRTRLIVTLAVVVSTVIVGCAVLSTLAVRNYLEARVSNRLEQSTERLRASIIGLHGLTIDLETIGDMARAESSAVVVDSPGHPPLWVN